jgi:hypothetical protein
MCSGRTDSFVRTEVVCSAALPGLNRRRKHVWIDAIPHLLATIALAACAIDEPSVPERSAAALAAEQAAASPARAAPTPAEVNKQLAQLRQLTAQYHNFEKAVAGGYAEKPLTNCWAKPEKGAMGYHYTRLSFEELLENDRVNLLEPEVLLYEPQAGGHKKLVGMEYIVGKGLWDKKHGENNPPVLLGQVYTPHSSLPIYKLHIWLWQDNPSKEGGMFADWNPMVSCKHAEHTDYF